MEDQILELKSRCLAAEVTLIILLGIQGSRTPGVATLGKTVLAEELHKCSRSGDMRGVLIRLQSPEDALLHRPASAWPATALGRLTF